MAPKCEECDITFTTENVLRLHNLNRHGQPSMDELIDALWPAMKQEYGDMIGAADETWRASAAHVLELAKIKPLSLGGPEIYYFVEGT